MALLALMSGSVQVIRLIKSRIGDRVGAETGGFEKDVKMALRCGFWYGECRLQRRDACCDDWESRSWGVDELC